MWGYEGDGCETTPTDLDLPKNKGMHHCTVVKFEVTWDDGELWRNV